MHQNVKFWEIYVKENFAKSLEIFKKIEETVKHINFIFLLYVVYNFLHIANSDARVWNTLEQDFVHYCCVSYKRFKARWWKLWKCVSISFSLWEKSYTKMHKKSNVVNFRELRIFYLIFSNCWHNNKLYFSHDLSFSLWICL